MWQRLTPLASIVGLLIWAGASTPVAAQADLTYFAPGNILPSAGLGVPRRKVSFSGWIFPLQIGTVTGNHAYIGTQLSQYHGVSNVNSPLLFHYPSRDNQCEPRDWTMQPCPAGKGHQGVDIRANDNRDKFWSVVAVEAGVVTSVTSNTTVAVRSGNHTVRYLHMDPASIAAAGIDVGDSVTQGQVLGKVSCFLSGSCQTSRHLHFDAYTGSAGAGNFYHVYPSLIAAYRRAWGLADGIVGGDLAVDAGHEVGAPPVAGPTTPTVQNACEDIPLANPLPGVDVNRFSSLWRHNCSIMGLTADPATGARSFTYYRPKNGLGDVILSDPVVFEGNNLGGHFSGIAKHYSRLCGVQRFAVEGQTAEEGGSTTVKVRGARPRLDDSCQAAGTIDDELLFTFIERVTPQAASVEHVIPEPRTTFSELTRNFLAITFYPGPDGTTAVLPYFRDFPAYAAEGGRIDSGGGLIPALSTDEGGVAISRVWMRKRALFTQGLVVTPRTVAHSMAGVDPSGCDAQLAPTPAGVTAAGGDAVRAERACGRVAAYLQGYVGFGGGRGFARDYFGRNVVVDETLNLRDPDTAYNWMRTMYSHESGRAPVIGREVFERGIRYGDDFVAVYYDGAPADTLRPATFYADPCNFSQPGCGSALQSTETGAAVALDQGVARQLSQITRELEALKSRLTGVESAVSALRDESAR